MLVLNRDPCKVLLADAELSFIWKGGGEAKAAHLVSALIWITPISWTSDFNKGTI